MSPIFFVYTVVFTSVIGISAEGISNHQLQWENANNSYIENKDIPKKTYTDQEIFEQLQRGELSLDDFEEGCLLIKWNVSHRTGSKIYHMPWGEFYDRTLIRDDEWDKLFCTEEEALAAGFRKSKN